MTPQTSLTALRERAGRRWREAEARLEARRGLLGRAYDFARDYVAHWNEDRVGGLAAEVAFYGVLSVFPGLIALVAVLGFLDRMLGAEFLEEGRQQVVGALSTFLTERADETIRAVERLFDDGSGGVLTVGLVAAVYAGSRGTGAILHAISLIHDVEKPRSWLRRRAVGVALTLATIATVAFTLAMFVLGPLLGGVQAVASAVGLGGVFTALWGYARLPLVVVAVIFWAVLAYRLALGGAATWRRALPGAALTAALWAGVSFGLRLYLAVAQGTNQVFGVLGGALIVLVWLYLLALALLAGAELNAVLAERRGDPLLGRNLRHHGEPRGTMGGDGDTRGPRPPPA